MADKTGISWTDHTFNIAWGCVKVSPGCAHCYAENLSNRLYGNVWGAKAPRRTFGAKHWADPLKWNRAAKKSGRMAKVFCSSMCDIFEDHPTIEEELRKLWPLIRETPWLTWQLLTKRPERIAASLPNDWAEGYDNVWLGTSIESNDYASRADALSEVPAALRFISYEPALGPLDMLNLDSIGWVIYGGESGPKFRRHELAWARDMRDRCRSRGIPFFYKQSPHRSPGQGVKLNGRIIHQFPKDGALPAPSPVPASTASLFG